MNATALEDSGCVRVTAAMSEAYTPMVLPYTSAPWSWDALSASAAGQLGDTVDIRQALIDALASFGIDGNTEPALQEDHPPLVDAYPALDPGADAADMSGQVIVTADTQPFPFFGGIEVAWR